MAGRSDVERQTMPAPLAVPEAPREASDSVAVDNAVGDEPHRPADEIRATIPLRRSRSCIRPAALARSVAGGLRCGRRREQPHVLALGRLRRTARTAVDPGRPDGAEHPSVEARIASLERLPEAVRIVDHEMPRWHTDRRSAGGNRTSQADRVRFSRISPSLLDSTPRAGRSHAIGGSSNRPGHRVLVPGIGVRVLAPQCYLLGGSRSATRQQPD